MLWLQLWLWTAILNRGSECDYYCCCCFGFCGLVRWEANSCGYHGDDGLLYRGHGKGEAFGPTYTSGDIVGAGINYAAQEFFFT